jgi:hypothetical protein
MELSLGSEWGGGELLTVYDVVGLVWERFVWVCAAAGLFYESNGVAN